MSKTGSLIDHIVREGATRILAAALEAEVNAHMAELTDERDERGHRLVVRNGCYQLRKVSTVAGTIEVKAPRVHDKRIDARTGGRKRFSSAILPRCPRRPLPKISARAGFGHDFAINEPENVDEKEHRMLHGGSR